MDFKDTIDWYDNNAKQYADKAYEQMSADSVEWFLSQLGNNPKVLDAGCGPGKHSRLLAERGGQPVGIDISKGLLGEAKRRNPEITFVEGSFLDMPFENSSFDGVFATASLVHLETKDDALRALSEFGRVMKVEGALFLKVKLQTGDNETEVVSDSLSGHERFFRYYTQVGLRNMLTTSGFSMIEERLVPDKFGRDEIRWLELLARKT